MGVDRNIAHTHLQAMQVLKTSQKGAEAILPLC